MTGNQIVQESTEEAQRLIDQTNEQVEQYKDEFALYSHDLVNNGTHVKDKMNEMKAALLATLAQYQSMVEATDFDALFPTKEVTRFNHQLEEFMADDTLHLLTASDLAQTWSEGAMSEEEKLELQQLIHDVTEEEISQLEEQAQPKAVGMEHEELLEESEPVELEFEEVEAIPEVKLVKFKPKNKR